jgi:hypothetical protein
VTLPWTRHVQAMAESEGAKPVASIYGSGRRTSIAQAVLVNSTAGHAFELDDIHKESIVHPGSLATPVALAYAEAAGGASGRDVITGMIAGYEVGTRVGNAATMSLFCGDFIRRARRAHSSPPQLQGAWSISTRHKCSTPSASSARRPAA